MYPENQDANPQQQPNNQPPVVPQQPTSPQPAPSVIQPMQSSQADQFQQPQAVQQPTPTYMSANQQAPKKKSKLKRILVVLLALIVIAAVAFGLHTYLPKLAKKQNTSKESSQFHSLVSVGSTLTAKDVAGFDKTNLFFGIFKNAAQQKVVGTKIGSFISDTANASGDPSDIDNAVYDYTSHTFSYEQDVTIGGFGLTKYRCVDGKTYSFSESAPEDGWQQGDTSDVTAICSKLSIDNFSVNDGLNAGNLTSAQADTFVSSLRAVSGLITVNSLSLATHDNKPYLHFDITVKPVKTSDGYYGMQNFMWAFKDTGLDPAAQPYNYFGAGGGGMRISYYVDPTTQLPAYAQLDTTTSLDDNGQPHSGFTYDYRHVEYKFGGQVPTLDLNSHDPLTLSWPTDKL